MKQLFLNVKDGSVKLIDQPMPTVRENMVLVESLYTIVSAGTERGLASFGGKNLVQKAIERPDQVKKVLEKLSTDGIVTTMESAFNKLAEPMPMGYSGVGRVLSCGQGVTEVQAGDLVAMVGTAYHCEINRVSRTMITKVPKEMKDYRQAAFCALGGIALEGIHQAEVVPGETVAVIGMGLVGHIVSRILDAYGCDVIGYDVADKSLPGTRLKAFINSGDDNVADMSKALTHGRGVDKVIITAATDSNAPMDLAAAITRDRGVICMIGVTQMNIDRRPYYERELSFRIARSYGPGRYDPVYEQQGVDYPIGYVRFTEGRNIEEFVRLISQERMQVSDLITHEIPFEQAAEAYEMITKNPKHERYIGVLLKYSENRDKWRNTVRNHDAKKKVSGKKVRLGLIGAGNFVRSTMLPIMKETGKYEFWGLATTGGVGAAQANDGTPFAYTTNNYKKLLADPDIDLIAVSTQHSSHARFVVEALKAGKHVYCEKPLCLTLEELDGIREAYGQSKGELFCGLNRRHAPLIRQIKEELKTDEIPAVYDFIANAGFIPKDHWVHDEAAGGGRILGEACHFVDLIQYLDGSKLTSLTVTAGGNNAYPMNDNVLISLKFASGAIGNIVYSSMGSKKYPKEQLRVLSNGAVYEMDNFIRLKKYGSTKSVKEKLEQDKGIRAEYEYIFEVLKKGRENQAIQDAFRGQELLIKAMQKVKRRMRILVYDVAADSGGAVTVLKSFYEEFCQDPSNEYVFVLSVVKLQETAHIKVLNYPWIKKSPLHRLYFDHLEAHRLVKRFRIDEVLSLQNIELPHVKVPQTVYEHNALPFSEYRFRPWEAFRPWFTQQVLGRMMKRSIRRARKVLVQTRWMKDEIVRQCRIPAEKVEVRFPPVEMLKTAPWQLDRERPVFFYPANASAYKNHRTFLKACEFLKKKGYDRYQVIWTVTGEENEGICRIRQEAEEKRLPIIFGGPMPREDLFERYASSVLVFPSYIETIGLPLLEARSAGARILAADCRYARDVVGDYERAEFFPAFDAAAV